MAHARSLRFNFKKSRFIYIIIYVMNDYKILNCIRGFGFGDFENFDSAKNCDVATLAVAIRF